MSVLIRRGWQAEDGDGTQLPAAPTPEVIFAVRGEADLVSQSFLRSELAWALSVAGPRLVLDLSGLTFCDLAGLDCLVAAERGARAQGRSVLWSGESPIFAWLRSTFSPGEEQLASLSLVAEPAPASTPSPRRVATA